MNDLIFDIQRFTNIGNSTNNTIITGTSDNDYIYNTGSSVAINAGQGADTVNNTGSSAIINGDEGNDFLYNSNGGNNVTISGGVGNDSLFNVGGYNVIMNGGAGNDTLTGNEGHNVTISGGAGDDLMAAIPDNIYSNDVFIYESGNDTISTERWDITYSAIVNFAATYKGWTKDDHFLTINADEGSLKILSGSINLRDANGNLIAYVKLAHEYDENSLDYSVKSYFTVLVGCDNVDNVIYAGKVGSSLYGGAGGNDTLYGNIGSDEFVYKYGDGNDNFYNIGAEDTVNINGVNLEQLASAEFTDNGISAKFTDGGSLNINGQAGTFLAGGQRFGADYQTKTFYAK